MYKPPTHHQKKKLEKFLAKGEEVLLVTSIGKRYFWVMLLFLFFIPAFFAYVPLLILLGYFEIKSLPWLKYLAIPGIILLFYNLPKYSHLFRMRQSYTYALTNKRFLIIRGLFSRKIVTAPLAAITHVTVEQSFAQRYLFDSGHLVIITAGFDQREIVIENIGDPVSFKIMLEELTDKLDDDNSGENDMRVLK